MSNGPVDCYGLSKFGHVSEARLPFASVIPVFGNHSCFMTIVKVFDIFVIVTTSSSLLVGMGMPEESFSVESTSQEPFFALLESAGSFFFASLGKFPSH